MRTINQRTGLVLAFSLLVFPVLTEAACQSAIPMSTPNSQLTDNGDGTVTDTKTGLMWKQCSEGQATDSSCTGSAATYSWQQALEQPQSLNASGGFANHHDWRLPNIKELRSIVEEACANPAINSERFPNTPSSNFWSASAYAYGSDGAWNVHFGYGYSGANSRYNNLQVRLVRGGQ